MATNAPYYQMRAGHVSNATNSTNAAQPQFVPDAVEIYEPSASAAIASPPEHASFSLKSDQIDHHASTDQTFEENHNFVELLEAATTAAATQELRTQDMTKSNATDTPVHGKGKRKRATSSVIDETAMTSDGRDNKRSRVESSTDPQFPTHEQNAQRNHKDHDITISNDSQPHDARAAGVHSAAALFRPLSESASRKYTRPPMSKLFMSLQLSPESFLQLQALAKAYMLDPNYPERQNCVGNRGRGDTDMVKLRLFNCVRDFLADEVGERFFGEFVQKPGQKEAMDAARALGEREINYPEGRLNWPRDGNQIISLVTPLMRRMVTNERQRQYAVETRKESAKKGKVGSVEGGTPPRDTRQGITHEPQSIFDPDLARHGQLSQPLLPCSPRPLSSSTTARLQEHADRGREAIIYSVLTKPASIQRKVSFSHNTSVALRPSLTLVT